MTSAVVHEPLDTEHCWRPRQGRYRRRPRRNTGPDPQRITTTDLPPVPQIPADVKNSCSHVFDFPMPPSAPASPRSKRPSMPRRQTIVLKAETDDEEGPPPPSREPPPAPGHVIFCNPWLQHRPLISGATDAMFGPLLVPDEVLKSKFSVDSSCWGEEHRHDSLAQQEGPVSPLKSRASDSVQSSSDVSASEGRHFSKSQIVSYEVEDEIFLNTMQALLTMPLPPAEPEDLSAPQSLPVLAPDRSDFVKGLKFVMSGANAAAHG